MNWASVYLWALRGPLINLGGWRVDSFCCIDALNLISSFRFVTGPDLVGSPLPNPSKFSGNKTGDAEERAEQVGRKCWWWLRASGEARPSIRQFEQQRRRCSRCRDLGSIGTPWPFSPCSYFLRRSVNFSPFLFYSYFAENQPEVKSSIL